ncbi:MAG TPA: hypothetical protein VI485_19365 [Vicinamibacterales bacterium]|nr:hypothetical protein [Vicinamibacterales bacterium]
MSRLSLSGLVAAASIAVMTPTAVSAVTYDKLAYLTFSGPVQVPGITLNAGTYRFALANPDTSRNVLHVLSNDGSTVYAMFHTIPDIRASVTPDAVVTFRETPAGVPAAVNSLFYGDEHRGYEFVYPKGGPDMSVEVGAQPEITYSSIPAAPTAEPIAEPETELVAEPMPTIEPAPEPLPAPPVAELPRTASPLPLVAAGGLTSLLVGLGLGLLRRRPS